MDLILHIGFPKTGTTTLQQNVFPHMPGYIEFIESGNSKFHAAGRLRAIMNRPHFKCKDCEHMMQWAKMVHSVAKQRDQPRLILSAEGISSLRVTKSSYLGAIRWHPEVVIERITQLQEIWRHYGELYILMTIRNQPEFLASHYSQHSNRYLQASTSHFEAFTNELLTKSSNNIDWLSWYKMLLHAVGKGRLLVLPVEGMGDQRYWQDLGNFCAYELKDYIVKGLGHANKKRLEGGNKWRLRTFNYRRRFLEDIKICQIDQPILYGISQGAVRILSQPINLGVALASPLLRSKELELHEQTSDAILKKFRKSNLELGKLIDWDLEFLGYS